MWYGARFGVSGGKPPSGILVYHTYTDSKQAMAKEILINSGFYDLATAYQINRKINLSYSQCSYP